MIPAVSLWKITLIQYQVKPKLEKNRKSLAIPLCLIGILPFLASCGPSTAREINWSRETKLTATAPEGVEQKPIEPRWALNEVDESYPAQVKQLSGSKFNSFPAHSGEVTALEVSKAGREAFTGGADGRVLRHQLIESTAGKVLVVSTELARSSREILSLSLSPDGSKLAVGQYSSVSLIDLSDSSIYSRMTRFKGRVTTMSWDWQQEFLMFGLSSARVYSWGLGSWNGNAENSLRALSQYRGLASGVVSLVTHPDQEIFFGADRTGNILVWRLIRTEEDLGLRVRDELDSSERISDSARRVTKLPLEISHFSIERSGENLFAVTNDGIYRPWKMKGLVPRPKTIIANDALQAFTELTAGSKPLLAVATREQRIKIFCASSKDSDLDTQSAKLAAISPTFVDSFSEIKSAEEAPVLWAVQKTGSVLSLELEPSLGRNVCP